MSGSKIILIYSLRLVVREWRRFVLPFFSLCITAIVMMLILLLSSASAQLLNQQARELLGGDVVIESVAPVDVSVLWQSAGITPSSQSNQLSFTGTLQSNEKTETFSFKVIDENYPLYGEFVLENGDFAGVKANEIFLDATGAERLQIEVGDKISFGLQEYILSGIISAEPTSLLASFRFLPRAIISQEGFAAASVDPAFLRVEYSYAAKTPNLDTKNKLALKEAEKASNGLLDVDIAGENQTGLQLGVQIVSDFLVIAVLITAVLSAVNVYASTLYLVTVERKSLAILLTLGFTKKRLVLLLGSALSYVVLAASILGSLLGSLTFNLLSSIIAENYAITLPVPNIFSYTLLCVTLIITIAISSFAPAVRRTLALNPKQILIGGEEDASRVFPVRSFIFITSFTLVPLVALATFLLSSITEGLLIIGLIGLVYVVIAVSFAFILAFVYKKRANFSFFIRSIISQKKADGLFGIVSFSSLFVALTALSTLALLQVSLERYLTEDLVRTIPTTYVLDVQPSQQESLVAAFPDLQLFKSIPARIVAIDNLRIQEELQKQSSESEVDRELGREFNLTARGELLSSEQVSAGEWSAGRPGEISVDEDFAKRANIKLGSTLVFLIQGFEVSGTVTNLRTTDSRSGLPFFYFVLSPEDIGQYPSIYFGYADYDEGKQDELGRFLAAEAPNVSMLKTQAIRPLIISVVSSLMIIVFVVTLPPLLIATLLIATLVVSSFAARRREGSRLRAIGATKSFVLRQYIAETISLTFVASVLAYLVSLLVSFLISQYFLGINTIVLFDLELVIGLVLIVLLVAAIGFYLFKTDKMALREILSYGENY